MVEGKINKFYSILCMYSIIGISLKVPSHQIRLFLKCYGWIGLDEYKDRGW
jgi:hypothetical protein